MAKRLIAPRGFGALALVSVLTACGGGSGNPIPTLSPPPATQPTSTPTPTPSASLSGRLLDDASAPVAPATITLAPYQTPAPGDSPVPLASPLASATTAPDGSFAFSDLRPGSYLLTADPADAVAVQESPAPYTGVDTANNWQGVPVAVHATVHEKVVLASGSNTPTIETDLRLTDNEVECDQEFNAMRQQLSLPLVVVDNDLLVKSRAESASLAAQGGGVVPQAPYAGVGSTLIGAYGGANPCYRNAQDALSGNSQDAAAHLSSLSFVANTMEASNGMPFSSIDYVQYP